METPVLQKQSLANFLNKSDKFLEQTLGAKKSEFVSNLLALSDSNKELSQCEPADLMKCAMNATALNLTLNKNLGHAYVIPYFDRQSNRVIPQFQIGYLGFVQLAIRSGLFKTINTCEIREGEIRRNKVTGHIDFLGENPSGAVMGYLAYIELLNGFQQSFFMTVEQLQVHASKYSKTFAKTNRGLWKDEFELMAKKTVLKLLLKRFGALSVEIQNAIVKDQTDSNGQYVDNPQGRTVIDAEVVEQNEPTEPQTVPPIAQPAAGAPAPKQVDFKQV